MVGVDLRDMGFGQYLPGDPHPLIGLVLVHEHRQPTRLSVLNNQAVQIMDSQRSALFEPLFVFDLQFLGDDDFVFVELAVFQG